MKIKRQLRARIDHPERWHLYEMEDGRILKLSDLARESKLTSEVLAGRISYHGIHDKDLFLSIAEYKQKRWRPVRILPGAGARPPLTVKAFDRGKRCTRDKVQCARYNECQEERIFKPKRWMDWFKRGMCVYRPSAIDKSYGQRTCGFKEAINRDRRVF